jgi:hypothetical protein
MEKRQEQDFSDQSPPKKTEFSNDLTHNAYEAPRRTYESWSPDAKIQNAVSTDGLMVPTRGLSGTHRRTMAA